jgi:hypothetical protein
MAWKTFEKESLAYLNEKFGKSGVKFHNFGAADSTVSDIETVTLSGNRFFIEVKEPIAQCGQFVLFPDTLINRFSYSEQNKSQLNEFSKIIIDYMNQNFSVFNSVGTKGKSINIDDTIFFNWIKSYYRNKNVKYFISRKNNWVIIPVENFENYFDASAKYRAKKSGSSNPSYDAINEIGYLLQEEKIQFGMEKKEKELFLTTSEDVSDKKLVGEKYGYMLRKIQSNLYKVRQLSNTINSNVIFTIELKEEQKKEDLLKFKNELGL